MWLWQTHWQAPAYQEALSHLVVSCDRQQDIRRDSQTLPVAVRRLEPSLNSAGMKANAYPPFLFLASGHVLMASYKYNCQDCPEPRSMRASREELVPSEGWGDVRILIQQEDRQRRRQPEGSRWWPCMFKTNQLQIKYRPLLD